MNRNKGLAILDYGRSVGISGELPEVLENTLSCGGKPATTIFVGGFLSSPNWGGGSTRKDERVLRVIRFQHPLTIGLENSVAEGINPYTRSPYAQTQSYSPGNTPHKRASRRAGILSRNRLPLGWGVEAATIRDFRMVRAGRDAS